MCRFATTLAFAGLLSAQTVVVTGSYEPVPLEDSNRAVTLLPASETARILMPDLTSLLREDASVDLRARGPGNTQADISIRGGGFGQTLILWNGIRMNDVQSGHHNLDTPVPLESLDRIEVLKGSGSTLYGSDAVGGVVNFVSRVPEPAEAHLRLALGNFGMNQEHVTLGARKGAWSERLAAARDFSSGFRFDRDYRNLALTSETRHGSTGLLVGLSDRAFGADQFYGNYPSWERTKTWFAAVDHSSASGNGYSVSYRRHTDLFVLYRERPQIYTNRHALESYQSAVRRATAVGQNATFYYGADAGYDSIESTNLGSHARGRAAGYGALELRALKRFSLNIGAREEVYRGLEHVFSPSLTGGVWLSSTLRLKAGVSHAFRLPSFTDLYYHDPANVGSPALKPEQAWSYDGTIDWRPADAISAEVTVFARREHDNIDYVYDAPAALWRATNFHRLQASGIEAALRWRIKGNGRASLNYSGLRLLTAAEVGISRYLANYPSQHLTAGYEGRLGPWLAVRTQLGVLERTGRRAYAVWDAAASWARGPVRPFVQFGNLGGTTYQEVMGVAMPGRSILCGLELRLTQR